MKSIFATDENQMDADKATPFPGILSVSI